MRRHHSLLREAASEFTGTALLMLGGISSIAAVNGEPWLPPGWPAALRTIVLLLGWGLTIAAIVYSPLGHISGAQINPAVSLALWLRHRHDGRHTLVYVTAQCVGALAGQALTAWLWGPAVMAQIHGGVTSLHPGLPVALGFTLEACATGGIVLIILLCARRAHLVHWTGLCVATFVWAAGSFCAPLTSAGFNPARSIGSALLAGDLHLLWLYILAPLAGAALAVQLYRLAESRRRRGDITAAAAVINSAGRAAEVEKT